MMIQNYLDMDFKPLRFRPSSFSMLVLLFSCKNSSFSSFSYLPIILEMRSEEMKEKVQNKIPTPQTSSIDCVESYMIGVKTLFSESKRNGMHTPMPMRVS